MEASKGKHIVVGGSVATVIIGVFVWYFLTKNGWSPLKAFADWWVNLLPEAGAAVFLSGLGILVAAGLVIWLLITVWVTRLLSR